jgi:hypothetical protein
MQDTLLGNSVPAEFGSQINMNYSSERNGLMPGLLLTMMLHWRALSSSQHVASQLVPL